MDTCVWTVPAARTKMGREHRVLLSARCADVLRAQRRSSEGCRSGVPPRRCSRTPRWASCCANAGSTRCCTASDPRSAIGARSRRTFRGRARSRAGARGAEAVEGVYVRAYRPLRAAQGADGRLGRVEVWSPPAEQLTMPTLSHRTVVQAPCPEPASGSRTSEYRSVAMRTIPSSRRKGLDVSNASSRRKNACISFLDSSAWPTSSLGHQVHGTKPSTSSR